MIKLINNTIDSVDLFHLAEWLQTSSQLTKGELTVQFEKEWSKYIGCKYSVFVNSGSSANLLMVYATKISGLLGLNNNCIIPAVSWATTVSPFIQFGLNPILCDVDKDLNIDINKLQKLHSTAPGIVMAVHILGTPCNMSELKKFCDKYDCILLEDSCESVGSTHHGKKTGSFGLMSSFSFYYGHHISTIEGGMVCTDNKKIYELLLMLRSHGWDRDLSKSSQKKLRDDNKISDVNSRFTMYEPSFNVRSTDLQAFIGLRQIKKLPEITKRRQSNLKSYNKYLKNKYWKLKIPRGEITSNFAYPVIHPKIKQISKALIKAEIDHRPLLCGNINRQPFFKKYVGVFGNMEMADTVHDYGLYLPNNPILNDETIKYICGVINKVIDK